MLLPVHLPRTPIRTIGAPKCTLGQIFHDRWKSTYPQTNKIVDLSDEVGPSPVGAALTTFLSRLEHLASIDCPNTTARWDEKHLTFGVWCAYIRGLIVSIECWQSKWICISLVNALLNVMYDCTHWHIKSVKVLRPRQNDLCFADNILKFIFCIIIPHWFRQWLGAE